MAPKKSTAVAQSASITDFFPRTRVSASSAPSSSQTLVSNPPPGKQRLPPRPDQEVISVSSASHITVSSGTRSIITVSDTSVDPMESISSRRYYVAPPKSSATKQPSKHSAPLKSSFKRKAKLDSDSEIESIDAVAYIPRSPARTRTSAPTVPAPAKPTPFSPKENLTHQLSQVNPIRKKPRISSPEPRPEPPIAPSDPGELIPSSQSDEQNEMVLRGPPRDPVAVMEDVDRWRNEASSPVSLPMSEPEESMDVDMDAPEGVVSVDEAPSAFFTREPFPEPQQQPLLLTPQQPRVQRSLPATPLALTEASKTAKIIADIKAKAYAQALSSPEDSPLGELKELEDSSDEEDLFTGFAPKNDPFGSPLSPVPTTTRYSLRDRGAPSTASTSRRSPSPSTSRRSRVPPPRVPVKAPKKVVATDPLGALLREKARADKGGKGIVALRRAEKAIRAGSPLSEESDEGELADWTNEAAALAAVKSQGNAWDSSSPGASNSDIDLSLNEEDRVRLLGEKRGKAVVGILESDRAKREAAKGKQKILGVQLWECETAFMHTDQTTPSFPVHLCGQRPLAFLKSSLDGGDLARAALLLDSGVFANLSLPNEIILYFCDLALSPCDMGLTTPAFRALSQIWKRPTVPAPGMPFRVVHATLVRLGAKQAIVDAMEWVPPPGAHPEALEPIQRNDALCRLIRLLMISTQSAQQTPSEIPDFIMAVLLVGMDPSSSPDLQRDIILTVDLLSQSIAPGTDISTDIETAICNKVIKFASGLQPINKAQLVALLAGGSGRTARIARWVAHAIITKSMTVSAAKYNDLPPLILLLEQALSPEIVVHKPETRIRGIFEVYEDTDYIDMAFYVQVLAVAISNVEGYVLQDARELTALPPGSPGKPAAEKPETMLTLVRIAIENLHSRIVDTRATHLDRSRAKGALKQLSMRMHYQQEAALRSRSGKKSRPIQQYFAKPK